MASNGVDPTTGAPRFPETDAPQTGADYEEVADFAAFVGTRLKGTTAERLGYDYAREGIEWYDTTLDVVFIYSGSTWLAVAGLPSDHAVTLTDGGGTTFVNQTYPLTSYARGGLCFLNGRVSRSAGSGTIVGVLHPDHWPEASVPFMVPSQGGSTTVGPLFLGLINAANGEIGLTRMTDSQGWDSGDWIPIAPPPWPRNI